MKHPEINDIIHKYTAGEASLEETNAALKEAGASFHLDPEKHVIRPEEAGRFGLLDTGTGSLDKVQVIGGRLAGGAVNQVLEDGSTNMLAYVLIGGKRYEVKGDALVDG